MELQISPMWWSMLTNEENNNNNKKNKYMTTAMRTENDHLYGAGETEEIRTCLDV